MARTVRTIKDNDGNELEVYIDVCNKCQKEMAYPRLEADKVEALFPFVREKIENGTPCLECVSSQPDGMDSLFSNEELEMIKNVVINQNLQ